VPFELHFSQLGDARRNRLDLNSSDRRARVHLVRHTANKMADAARRFQNAPGFETESLQRGVHATNDFWRSVLRVESRSFCGFVFFFGQE